MRRITHPKATLLGAGLIAATLLLAGCSAGSGGASDQSGGTPVQAPQEGVVGADSDTSFAGEENRDVIVTGSMTVTADDPLAASREAVRIAETAGGRVDGRSEYAPANGDTGSAILTLRIPAEKLQSVIDDLSELGRADEISTDSTDVTVQVADLDSRIATKRGIIDRLNTLFGQAATIQDLIELETRIAEHQAELESLEGQQRAVADQVALSTLTLSLRSEAEAPVQEPLDFLSGLETGWGAFVTFFAGLLVALGVLLPWLATAALITAGVIFLVKWRRRRAAARASA